MFNFLPSWVKYLPLIILLSIGGWLYTSNKSLQKEVVEINKELSTETIRADSLGIQLKYSNKTALEQSQRLLKQSSEARVANEENNRLNSVLEGYKGNEKIAIDNPEDIERRANNAINSLMLDYECSTGNTSSCSK